MLVTAMEIVVDGAGIPIARPSVTGGSALSRPTFDEDSMWESNLRSSEAMKAGIYPSGPYPERDGEPDCSFYIRTGLCRFGSTCRFNHPPNRKLAIATARMKGEYPERIGQPECQYYLKTGTCKFGATCKFNHPKDKAGIVGKVPLNILGYPQRPNEQECAYYLRTGQCKFGTTCKFHHPQPFNMTSLHDSPVYPSVQSPTTPGQQSYSGEITSWSLSRASIIPSPRWQAPSSYTSLILPQGVVSVPGWNTYMGQLGSLSPSESQHQIGGNNTTYETSRQSESAIATSPGTYSGYRSGSVPVGYYPLQRDNVFPERPGQLECQYYMKTGDCKFGAVCKFHHPKERLVPAPDCILSPMGLPLRPGEPLCIFYTRYGICKFGPSCKFDHPPMGYSYSFSPSPSADASSVRRYLGSSSISNDGLVEAGSGRNRGFSLSEAREVSPGDDDVEAEG